MAGLKVMGVDEFLSYDPRSRSEFLGREWKEKGWLTAFLHRRLPFAVGWQHGIPRVDVRDDAETRQPKRMIFTGSYKCLEEEEVLKGMYRRDRDTGARTYPPTICPPCLMIEHIYQLVATGQIHWLEPVFDFDSGEEKYRQVIRASGLFGGYKESRLDDQQKGEFADAGLSFKTAWKENIQASLKYIFCLVDCDGVGKGVQIMKEGSGLGDKVKIAIQKEMKRNPRNKALGDPVQNPYAFQFEYKEHELPANKYDAMRVEVEMTDEINRLISETAAPDISMLSGHYSPGTLRAQLEAACLIDLPWDSFFTQEAEDILAVKEEQAEAPPPRATAPQSAQRAPAAPTPRHPRVGREEDQHGVLDEIRQLFEGGRPRAPTPPQRPAAAAPRPPTPRAPAPPPVAQFSCDGEGCAGILLATDTRCEVCGMEYEVEAPPPAPPPRPALPRRSELGSAPVTAPGRAPVAAPGRRPMTPEESARVRQAARPAAIPATRGQVVAPAAQHRAPPPAAPASRAAASRVLPAVRPPAPRAPSPPPKSQTEVANDVPDETEPPPEESFGEFGDDEIPF